MSTATILLQLISTLHSDSQYAICKQTRKRKYENIRQLSIIRTSHNTAEIFVQYNVGIQI